MKKTKTSICKDELSNYMNFGPITVPLESRKSKEKAIEYVLEKTKDYLRDNSVFKFEDKDNKKVTLFFKVKNKKK